MPVESSDMNAIEQIIEELSDSGKSLEGPLLKTKVLASRIKNEEIREWASQELVGYRDIDELPTYRYVRPVYQWVVLQRGMELPLAPVSILVFDEETRKRFFRGRMEGAVASLESLAKRNDGEGFIRKEFGADICQFLTARIVNNEVLKIRILKLFSTTDNSETTQVLAGIRSMLQDFMLKLEADVPVLDKPLNKISSIGATDQARITNIFHNTIINVTGDRNTIVTGDSNKVSHT